MSPSPYESSSGTNQRCSTNAAGHSKEVLGRLAARALMLFFLFFSALTSETTTAKVEHNDTGATDPSLMGSAWSLQTGIGVSIPMHQSGTFWTPGPYLTTDIEHATGPVAFTMGLFSNPLLLYLFESRGRTATILANAGFSVGRKDLRGGAFVTAGIWNRGLGLQASYHPFFLDEDKTHGFEGKLVVFPWRGNRTVILYNLAYTFRFSL